MMKIPIFLLTLIAMLLFAGCGSSSSEKTSCVLIDTDYDVDDMMAIPMVISNKQVVGVVSTEGCSMPGPAASNLNNFFDLANVDTSVIAGKATNRTDFSGMSWLQFYRNVMYTSNGLFEESEIIPVSTGDYVSQVESATQECETVTLLVLSPFSSFVNYFPSIKQKVDKVIMQGKPGNGFNCYYNTEACLEAEIQMRTAGINMSYVDVPDTTPAYAATLPMVEALKTDGIAGVLKDALINNTNCSASYTSGMPVVPGTPCTSETAWLPSASEAGAGNMPLLWDDSAAMYLINPQLFSNVGTHMEPTLINNSLAESTAAFQEHWTQYTNR